MEIGQYALSRSSKWTQIMAEGPGPAYGLSGASLSEINTQLKLANQNMSRLIQTIADIFPRVSSSFIFPNNASSVTVSETNVQSSDRIVLLPSNAAAATMVGSSKSPWVSTVTSGASFVVSTASGSATGTGTFNYLIFNPV